MLMLLKKIEQLQLIFALNKNRNLFSNDSYKISQEKSGVPMLALVKAGGGDGN